MKHMILMAVLIAVVFAGLAIFIDVMQNHKDSETVRIQPDKKEEREEPAGYDHSIAPYLGGLK